MSLSTLRIGIVGLGQIGGSIATCLRTTAAPSIILGYDLRTELLTAALERHAVTGIARSEAELIESSDIVLIAVPVREILAFLKRQQEALRRKVAVTDTGSVKQEITHLATELGLSNFIGGHPLAGTERQGVVSWSGTLFEDANYFLTIGCGTDRGAVEMVTKLVTMLGAKAIPVDPEQHDRIFAVTSNLPHIIAYAITHIFKDIPDGDLDKTLFRSPSFLGATRVGGSDPEMVFQMLWHNRANLSISLTTLQQRLDAARTALVEKDEGKFRKLLGLS
jgi:prephenate dehydrogenase